MLLIIYICVVTSQFITVKSQKTFDAPKISMDVKLIDNHESRCSGYKTNYTFEEGTAVEIVVTSDGYINNSSLTIVKSHNGTSFIYLKSVERILKFQNIMNTMKHDGKWEIRIENHKDANISRQMVRRGDDYYTETLCKFNVIVLRPLTFWERLNGAQKYSYISGAVGLFVVLIIVIQTGVIVHYKKKAQAARVHQNLSVKRESNDTARYSVGVTRKGQNRDSGLYETLEEVNLKRTVAPIPPAIETLPKNAGKAIQHKKENKQMLPLTQSSSSTHLLADTGYCDETLRIQDRDPMPLPEEYEEVGTEETYEPPPDVSDENMYEAPPEVDASKSKMKSPPKKAMPFPLLPLNRTMRLNTVNPSDMSPNTERKNKRKPDPTSTMPKVGKKIPGKNPMAAELNNILQRRNAGQSILNPHEMLSKTPSTASNTALPPKPLAKKPQVVNKPPVITNTNAPNKLPLKPKPPPSTAAAVSKQAPPLKPKLNPPISEVKASPAPKRIPPQPILKGLPPAPIPQLIPPAHQIRVSTHNNEPNSSDEEWTYEELPEINLNKPAPRPKGSQALPAPIPQIIPPAHQIPESYEDEIYNDPNNSDDEWTYEELPEIKLNKPVNRWNKK